MNAFDSRATAIESAAVDDPPAPILARLSRAAKRMEDKTRPEGTYALRERQEETIEQFAQYLDDLVSDPDMGGIPPFGRIIQPPRTGKTVIAGHIIGATGLPSLFIVPSKQLIGQVADELRKILPGTPVGVYYGEQKSIVQNGVNVATYQILVERWNDGTLPAELTNAALVFADEGHHSMTAKRMTFLRKAFDPHCLRIALTATPDFSLERTLSQFFPHLIHEVTLPEAIELELLAPLRVWVAEVDADGSTVMVRQGDYQEAVLGRLMSAAPFFKAVETFRYLPENRELGTIVTCASKQQAYDLVKYLETHRPESTPRPQLILSDTPQDVRERALERFERRNPGDTDTLVVVGVLIEGWSSLRCKLLIDIAPTISRVRATQKFCRVLTRDGENEARIYMVVPRNLPQGVMMPMDILAPSLDSYEAGDLIGSKRAVTKSTSRALRHPRIHPIEQVELKSRILMTHKVRQHELKPNDIVSVRRVLASSADFHEDRPLSTWSFRSAVFQHRLFYGRGDSLMRFCGFPSTPDGYRRFLMRYAPDAAVNHIYRRDNIGEFASCADEYADLAERLNQKAGYALHDAASACRKAWLDEAPDDALDAYSNHEEGTAYAKFLVELTPIEQNILTWRYGFVEFPEKTTHDDVTLQDIGKHYDLSRTRIGMLEERALKRLREKVSNQREAIELAALAAAAALPAVRRKIIKLQGRIGFYPPGVSGCGILRAQIQDYGIERYKKLVPEFLWLPGDELDDAPTVHPLVPRGTSGYAAFYKQVADYGFERYGILRGCTWFGLPKPQ